MSDPLTIIQGDALSSLQALESESVQCCVTSPPYWGLRDYGHEWQIGLEATPEEYVERLVGVFAEVKRALRKDGTLWLNVGDCYSASGKGPTGWNGIGDQETRQGFSTCKAKDRSVPRWGGGGNVAPGCKPKDLIGIPWMVAFALRSDGWYLRCDVIWSKPNGMPESVEDRPTRSHEYLFLLSKSQTYYYDHEAIKEPTVTRDAITRNRQLSKINNTPGQSPHSGLLTNSYELRNVRSVWTTPTQPYTDAHFAAFPEKLIQRPILACTSIGSVVLDPFAGSGTTGRVAIELGRKAILIEPKAEYVEMIKRRCQTTIGLPL